jgi:hypothetical protein
MGRTLEREKPSRWPKRLKIAGVLLAIAGAPLLAVNLVLGLVAVLPGLLIFTVGRLAE